MAITINPPPPERTSAERAHAQTAPDSPILDLMDAAMKTLIRSAKKRRYITQDQISALLSTEDPKSEQIEDVLAKFSQLGINVVETEEAEADDPTARAEEDDDDEEEKALRKLKHPSRSKVLRSFLDNSRS